MATTEELFISISPQIYRKGKSSGLMGQFHLLESLKHLQNLKVLSRQKTDLRKELHRLMSSLLIQINSIQEKMPTPKIPKSVKHHHETSTQAPKKERTFSKRDEIEEELREIQAKLRELNRQ